VFDAVIDLLRLIRASRLIRGIIVHPINRRTPINHDLSRQSRRARQLPHAGGPCKLLQCGRNGARRARSDNGADPQTGTHPATPRLLADRRIRYVLAAYVASGSADGFLPVVLSFAVLRLTGTPASLGLVLAGQSAAALLLTLAGGLAGDRFARGRILAGSLAVRAAAASVLAATLLTGTASFPLLLAMAALYGCADGFFGPASTALLPDIVPRAKLAPANALLGGTTSTAAVASPAIAGIIVAALGPGAGFAVQAAVLTVAAGSLMAARLPADRPAPVGRPRPVSQLKTGWAEFARLQWLWLLTGQWTVFSMVLLAPVAVLGPAIAGRYLGGPLAWGIIRSSLSLGAVTGQLAAGRIKPSARPALRIAWLMPAMTTQALALGLGAPLAAVAAAAVITGLAIGLQSVLFQTAMQTSIPPEALARVTAFDLLGSEGGQPIGYALAGPLGAAIGARTYLAYSAAGIFIAASAFTRLRPLHTETGTPTQPQTSGEPTAGAS
jgi:MFS family permease